MFHETREDPGARQAREEKDAALAIMKGALTQNAGEVIPFQPIRKVVEPPRPPPPTRPVSSAPLPKAAASIAKIHSRLETLEALGIEDLQRRIAKLEVAFGVRRPIH